jgi:hypothetical protein
MFYLRKIPAGRNHQAAMRDDGYMKTPRRRTQIATSALAAEAMITFNEACANPVPKVAPN